MSQKRPTLKDNSSKYSNCKIYHPNGKLMCVNSQKKGRWYVEKTNAEILELKADGTLASIKLTFTPKGEGFDDDDVFGLSIQETKCVVTGETDITKLTKHHVVPYCYRKYMPLEYKSRNHHDVVFMTEDSHDEYEQIANDYRDQTHEYYGVPTMKESQKITSDIINSPKAKLMGRINGYVTAIRDKGYLIPEERLRGMRKEILKYIKDVYDFKTRTLTDYWMERIERDVKEEHKRLKNTSKVDPHELLVKTLVENGELDVFIIGWRYHFINTMNPPYMPKGWDMNRTVKVRLK